MDFQKALTEEKNRLSSAMADLNKKKADIDKEIAVHQRELDAIHAYETAKKGKPVKRTRSTSIKAQVLALIKANPCKRGDVAFALKEKGIEVKSQTLSNTLSNLKNSGAVTLADGTYSAT
jgi:23S rRNA pseudoU1915 N3-methylase RlmH